MMNKKLLAVAVAGALAAPVAAYAQTTVTISGILKTGVDNVRYSGNAARTGNTSETRVTDNSSRVIFNVAEDLGNGLAAIGQIDMRYSPDIAANGYPTSPTNVGGTTFSAGGNTWVGLKSKSMGQVIVGRQDLHYGLFENSDIVLKAGALMAAPVSLFDYIGKTAIAGGTRTNNVVMYDMPAYGGFTLRMAWSANPTGVETDLRNTAAAAGTNTTGGNSQRKGQAWNINPRYDGGTWGVRYSYWNQQSDGGSTTPQLTAAGCSAAQTMNGSLPLGGLAGNACLANATTPADQQGHTLLGWMNFGGLRIGAGWNDSRLKANDFSNALFAPTSTVAVPVVVVGPGGVISRRTAWTISSGYIMGPHNFQFHYTKANDDKIANLINAANPTGTTNPNGAKMWALAYVYDLSKRTSVGLTYAQISNNTTGTYDFFTNGGGNSLGQFGSPGSSTLAGEKEQLFSAVLRHAF